MTALRKAAQEGVEANQKIKASERAAMTEKMVFSASTTTGRFLAAQRDSINTFLASLNHAQQKAFCELVEKMPQSNSAQLFTELGDGGKDKNTAAGIYSEIQDAADAKVWVSLHGAKTLTHVSHQFIRSPAVRACALSCPEMSPS